MKASSFFIIFPIFFFNLSFSEDTLTSTNSIRDGNNKTTLVSSGQIFELGFFSPHGNSTNRYVGIWYKITPNIVVWVANRNNPLNGSFGEFSISKQGNLVLLDRAKRVIWHSNSSTAKQPVARILDSGNLVLEESLSESYLWQSFDHPTDTLLPSMKLGWDFKKGLDRYLTSWKALGDPSEGNNTFRMYKNVLIPQALVKSGSARKVRFGPWGGVKYSGLTIDTVDTFIRRVVDNENESYLSFVPVINSVIFRVTLTSEGPLELHMLHIGSAKWTLLYSYPSNDCDHYDYCGANAICRVNGDPICQCLEGFSPISSEEWELFNWSKGCVRKTPVDCRARGEFVNLVGVKLPDLLQFWLNKSMSLEECKAECLKNCSCVAFSNSDVKDGGWGCLIWSGDLIDIRDLVVNESEIDIYVRSESIGHKSKRKGLRIKLAASISSGISLFILLLLCLSWKLKKRETDESKVDDIELPLFDLATIKIATNNFSPENMLGKGGFGTVYKGNLLNGQEIAVKRLSNSSTQGLREFKNEVELIAKLQHKNLVALLGCCVEGDERILIYEYMANKSLDRYIFDKKESLLASWEKSFEIIMGIARGFLYLHQDSKLPIIHRDLKAANILLDINMNPKISDFGLSRIFGEDENEIQTKTIVGTYGYMSPEYAVDGIFSVKSDVFSFGVLLLEIVSGRKNRNFTHRDHEHNLLGHAWLMWNRGEAKEVIDLCFKDSGFESQILWCIHVGLLCVQKHSEERPRMNSVVLMLSNQAMKIPHPKEPGFFVQRSSNNIAERSTRNEEFYTENTMTNTLNGR